VSITDLTADMLTMIRNASSVKKESVTIKRSKLLESICTILKGEGFISNFKSIEDNKQGTIKIYLKYGKSNTPAITGLEKITKPGLRIYKDSRNLPRVLGGVGIAIVSTSQGLMTANDARSRKIGGEIICKAW